MKFIFRLGLSYLILLGIMGTMGARASDCSETLKAELAAVGATTFTSPTYKPGILRHLVLFRYKDSVTTEQKNEVKRRFLALLEDGLHDGKNYILSIETGKQNSGEGVDHAFEQAFIVTFRSEGDRNFYVGQPIVTDSAFYDPAHQAFKEFVGPFLREPIPMEGVLVFDFRVENP